MANFSRRIITSTAAGLLSTSTTFRPVWAATVSPDGRFGLLYDGARKAADAKWATQHLAPWVKRRLTGKSSGDMVTAKRPELTRISES